MSFNLGGKLSLDAGDFVRSTQQAKTATQDLSAEVKALDAQKIELEADASQARDEISRLTSELVAVDGMDARAEVQADIVKAQNDLAEIESELKAVDGKRAEVQVEADTAAAESQVSGSMDEIVGLAKSGGGAAAAAFVSVFTVGMDRMALDARFEDQFGLVADQAERMGKEAGDLYMNGWGNSLEEVQVALGRVNQALVETGTISEQESVKLTESALAIAGVWGEDVNVSIDAVRSMLLNGLAPDAETATDILIQGLQDGANMTGDLYDSIDEYSLHFGDWGIAADEMMSIFSTGMLNGERDTDKLGDAVKEMRLRTLESTDEVNAAFASIGLSADGTREKIAAGGPAAREAFSDIINGLRSVEDPVEQNRLAVALIGTQYEDMSAQALDSLAAVDDALVDTTGNTEALVENQGEATSAMTTQWRTFKTNLEIFAEEAASAWITTTQVIKNSAPLEEADVQPYDEWLSDAVDGNNLLTDAVWNVNASQAAFTVRQEEARQAADKAAAAMNSQEKSIRDAESATRDAVSAIRDLQSAEQALVDPTFAAMDAANRHREALEALNAENGNTVENQQAVVQASMAMEAAMLEAGLSADSTADDLVQFGLDAGLSTEQAWTLAAAMLETKGRADDLAGEYAVDVKESGASETEEQLRRVKEQADKTAGEYYVDIITRRSEIVLGDNRATGRASGGPVAGGETYWVGEEGPELFVAPAGGGRIIDATTSKALMNPHYGSGPATAVATPNQANTGFVGGFPLTNVYVDGRELSSTVNEIVNSRRQLEGLMR